MNFAALLPSVKVFSENFMHMRGSADARSGQSVKAFSAKRYTDSRKYSPVKVSSYMVYIVCVFSPIPEIKGLHPTTTYVGPISHFL